MNDASLELAEEIKKEIISHFVSSGSVVSGNLINTIKVYKNKNGWSVDIPAEIYDRNVWEKEHVIVHTGKGSYANTLNESSKHKDYVLESISKAIKSWEEKNKFKTKKRGI